MPEHPIGQLTTAELSRYRRELASSLKGLPPDAPVRESLAKKLDAVLAEQEQRQRIAQANGGS